MTRPSQPQPSQPSMAATLAGAGAILMWALLALFTDASGPVPPFQLAALSFAIGTVVCIAYACLTGAGLPRISVSTAFFCTLGLFGFHALYFTALKNAPPAQASLIVYLWPMMIVIGSATMPGQRVRWFHLVGGLAGFIGTGLIITDGEGFAPRAEYLAGYIAALGASLTWGSYSLALTRLASVPSTAVVWYCMGSTILSLICHVTFEQTVFPNTVENWLAIIGLGLMPVGAAFFLWDIGMKRGHVAVIGPASYAAPLLSTLILVSVGRADMTIVLAWACILITGGAILAAKDLIFGRKSQDWSVKTAE